MKQRMKELGDAINETLANSDQIAEVISRIKAEGFDVFLVLEATVGYSQTGNEAPSSSMEEKTSEAVLATADLKVTPSDRRFLKSLRIAVDDHSQDKAA
jgi:hypothetical protein